MTCYLDRDGRIGRRRERRAPLAAVVEVTEVGEAARRGDQRAAIGADMAGAQRLERAELDVAGAALVAARVGVQHAAAAPPRAAVAVAGALLLLFALRAAAEPAGPRLPPTRPVRRAVFLVVVVVRIV